MDGEGISGGRRHRSRRGGKSPRTRSRRGGKSRTVKKGGKGKRSAKRGSRH